MLRKLAVLTAVFWIALASACGGGNGGDGSSSGTPSDDSSTPNDDDDGDDGENPEAASGDSAEADAAGDMSSDDPLADGPVTDDAAAGDVATDSTDGSEADDSPAGDPAGDPEADAGTEAPTQASAPDNGPDDQQPVGDGGDSAALVGLWDYSRMTEDGNDLRYFAIDAAGLVTEYDYQADSIGTGEDCHVVTTAAIASRGDDRYDIQDTSGLPGSQSVDDVLITAGDGVIVFRYLGTSSEPGDGNEFGPEGAATLTGITDTFPAIAEQEAGALNACAT